MRVRQLLANIFYILNNSIIQCDDNIAFYSFEIPLIIVKD